MEAKNINCSFEQELAAKVGELTSLRREREEMMVDFTLTRIAGEVKSKEADVMAVMARKGHQQQEIREIVEREIKRAADGVLWCPEYDEKRRSDQRVMAYTGCHWEDVESQQWKDFVAACAERIGVPEAQRMSQTFMTALFEGVAYNLAKYRRQRVPAGEVWLNMRNGTLVLHKDGSVALREHRKDDLFTYTLPYAYDAEADCPQWHRFLDRVLPEGASQQVLAEFIGYCFKRGHELERMLWLYGGGLNGKSVTLEVIEALLGQMNVSYLSLSDLTNDDVKRAGIEGKMLNISHESGKDVNPNVLKQLTSGEPVTVKRLYLDPRETNDYGKFIGAFNDLPRPELTCGYFRHLIILPYEVTIPKEEIDRQLTTKLKTELPGILNWVLAALPGLLQRSDFTPSEKCERAMYRYRLLSDNVRLFLSEMCVASDSTTKAFEIYQAYRTYCLESQLKPIGRQKFYDRLEALGCTIESYGNVKYFHLRLTQL